MKNVYVLLGGEESDMRDRLSAILNSINRNGEIGADDLIIATGFKNETDFYTKSLANRSELLVRLKILSSYDTESNASSIKPFITNNKVLVVSGAKHLERFKKCLADAGIDDSNFEFISEGCIDIKYENILTTIYKFKLGRKLFQYFTYISRKVLKNME